MSINKQTKLESIFSNFKESKPYFLYQQQYFEILINRQPIYHKYIYILTLYLPTSQDKLYVQNFMNQNQKLSCKFKKKINYVPQVNNKYNRLLVANSCWT